MFRTEFTINIQSSKEEEVYFDKILEILSSMVAEEDKVKGKIFDVEYIPNRRMNRIGFYWKFPKSIEIPSKENWHPEGVMKNCKTPREGIEWEAVNCMEKTLKKVKWLSRHGICDIATMWM